MNPLRTLAIVQGPALTHTGGRPGVSWLNARGRTAR